MGSDAPLFEHTVAQKWEGDYWSIVVRQLHRTLSTTITINCIIAKITYVMWSEKHLWKSVYSRLTRDTNQFSGGESTTFRSRDMTNDVTKPLRLQYGPHRTDLLITLFLDIFLLDSSSHQATVLNETWPALIIYWRVLRWQRRLTSSLLHNALSTTGRIY